MGRTSSRGSNVYKVTAVGENLVELETEKSGMASKRGTFGEEDNRKRE